MANQDGLDYVHNYDVIVKWLAEALRGETLEVIGVKTGRIVDVFGFEPVDVCVHAGRVDVMFRDDEGQLFHLEEQRNLKKKDLYRFASHHFMAAEKWGDRVTEIVLASGKVFEGEKSILTHSGTYTPLVVDLSQRNGVKRLEEIRRAIDEDNFHNWLELVFLPLYGKETGKVRQKIVENSIRFEIKLFKEKKISARLLAATLIMSNKMIEKKRLEEIWEEIKMLDILEIAHEKGKSSGLKEGKDLGLKEGKDLGLKEGKDLGLKEGKDLGLKEGKDLGIKEGKSLGIIENSKEMLLDALIEKFDIVPKDVIEKIKSIENVEVLKVLFRKVFKCDDIERFESLLDRY